MSKFRNLQFLRNVQSLGSLANHGLAVDAAKTAIGGLSLKDGEIALYRYEIANETESTGVHTIVGVAYGEGANQKIEIVANYDMLTTVVESLDATVRNTSDGTISVNDNNEITVTGNTGAYVAVEVVETDGKLTGIKVKENIDETIATRISEAITALDGAATIATIDNNDVVTLKAGIVETDGIVSNNTNADIVLAKVAKTGAAVDVAVADAGGIITATTVEGALAEIAAEIDAMDYNVSDVIGFQPTAQGEKVKVTIQQKDGKITNVAVDETALEDALEELQNATTLEGVDAIEVNYDENGNGGTVSLKIAEGENPDKVLTQDENGLRVNLGLTWGDNTDNKITLTGKDGVEIASIDASKFIKDGMLEDVKLVNVVKADDGTITIDGDTVAEGESVQGITTSGRYFKFTWNTYTYNESGEATKTTKVEYLNVESLVDSYTAGNEWIVFNQDTNEISHNLSTVIPTAGEDEEQATSKTVGNATTTTVDNAGETVTFKVPTITVDRAGHVTAASDSEITITLPSYIGTAVQTITGETAELNNSDYVNVKAEKTANAEGAVEYKLTSKVKVGAFPTADTELVEGLATVQDVEDFVLNNSSIVEGTEHEIEVSDNADNNGVTTYTVKLAEPASITIDEEATADYVTPVQTPQTPEGSTQAQHTRISDIEIDEYGRVIAYTKQTVTENFDLGTY